MLKRASFFIFLLSLFFLPGQSYYSVVESFWQPTEARFVEMELPVSFYPINFTQKKVPFLTAESVLVMDADSAIVLYGKNEKLHFLPASTVKMMTGLVAMEYYKMDDVLQVGSISDFGQDMNLFWGEEISVFNLLTGVLVASANDAALVLAQNYPGGQSAFVERMNQKAAELNLTDTYFANPTGLDTNENEQILANFSYTTSFDLAHLARWGLKKDLFRQLVGTPREVVTDASGQVKHQLYNINVLLTSLPGVRGVKTGFTDLAGECLVTLVERDGKRIITVVLGSKDRFGETRRLVDWVFENHRWEEITPVPVGAGFTLAIEG